MKYQALFCFLMQQKKMKMSSAANFWCHFNLFISRDKDKISICIASVMNTLPIPPN